MLRQLSLPFVSNAQSQTPPSSLSWRVPTAGDPRLLRIGLAQVGLASVVAALILMVAAPREWLVPGLLGLIPVAIFMAFRRWNTYRQTLEGANNVRIDDEGVHWLNATGQEHSFRRGDIVGFSIGRNSETLRPVSALTLHLAGGFESQPIELHPPATSDAVRQLLGESWNIVERDEHESSPTGGYDVAVSVYGECHDEFQEWHWEGTKEELRRFFAMFAATADELALPPAGAKPLFRTILLSRREPTRVRLAHARIAQFEEDTIAAPAEVLRAIAARAAELLEVAEESSDGRFDVALGSRSVWTFHFHVRPD